MHRVCFICLIRYRNALIVAVELWNRSFSIRFWLSLTIKYRYTILGRATILDKYHVDTVRPLVLLLRILNATKIIRPHPLPKSMLAIVDAQNPQHFLASRGLIQHWCWGRGKNVLLFYWKNERKYQKFALPTLLCPGWKFWNPVYVISLLTNGENPFRVFSIAYFFAYTIKALEDLKITPYR